MRAERDTGWRPIGTLPDNIDTQVVLWNPCDGIHLPDVCAPSLELDEIRSGKIYTHWRRVKPPAMASEG